MIDNKVVIVTAAGRGMGGAIVNISTYAVFEPELAFPVSASTRAALAGFTKLHADQYAADGIRINNILPSFIDSFPETEERRCRIPMGATARSPKSQRPRVFSVDRCRLHHRPEHQGRWWSTRPV